MSTTMKELNVPSNETTPEQAYRNAVIAAAVNMNTFRADQQLLIAAGRFAADFADDVIRLRRRFEEATAPAKAEELLRQAAALDVPPVDPRTMPLDSFKTTLEVIEAWSSFTSRATHQSYPAREEAHRLRMDARTIKGEAMRFLLETADPGIAAEIEQLGRQIASLRIGIEHRSELANLESSITSTRQHVDSLLKGPRRRDTEQKVSEGRARLRALEAMWPGVADAVAADARDEKKIASLQTRIDELRREQLNPKRMRWSVA